MVVSMVGATSPHYLALKWICFWRNECSVLVGFVEGMFVIAHKERQETMCVYIWVLITLSF